MKTKKSQKTANRHYQWPCLALLFLLMVLLNGPAWAFEYTSIDGTKIGNGHFTVLADTIKPAEPEAPDTEEIEEVQEEEYDENRPPRTISEAVQKLSEIIPNHEVAIIRRTTEEEFTGNAVATLGPWMKQEWDLINPESDLANFFYNNEIYSTDEMSEIILIAFWRRLNGVPLDLDRLILERMKYWDDIIIDGRQ